MRADYRVRVQIRESLENNYNCSQNRPSAAYIAFQLAFCYQIGFGVKSDESTSHTWLEKSNKQPNDLMIEKEAVRPARIQSERIIQRNGHMEVNMIHEYRIWGLNKLREAMKVCEGEVIDMVRTFGELHFIPLNLNHIIAYMLDELGEVAKSVALRMRIRDQIVKKDGIGHPSYIQWTNDVARSHENLGQWMEVQQLRQEILKTIKNTQRSKIESFIDDLVIRNTNNVRWEPEMRQVLATEMRNNILGNERPHTLGSMNKLASMYNNQEQLTEAQAQFVQAVEIFKRGLDEDPSTLGSMNNLASTYNDQGRWTEAEELRVQVMETTKRVLGEEHPSTLVSMNNLALTYNDQGRWTEAEELFVTCTETTKRVLGEVHPSTLVSMNNLALTYNDQGRWTEAEKLFVQVMQTTKRVLGEEHPDTLVSMNNLASTYNDQGRWIEAEELFVQVMETKKRVLGEVHPSTLASMNNLASTYNDQGRWTEAEELRVQVMET